MTQPVAVFPAVDGKALGIGQLSALAVQGIFTETALQKLRPGEIGCTLSHYALWQKLAQQSGIEYALVLEDDMTLLPHFNANIEQQGKNLPSDFDLVYLYNDAQLTRIVKTSSPHISIPVYPSCAYGYLISRRGAMKLIKAALPINEPIDNFISSTFRAQFSAQKLWSAFIGKVDRQQQLNIYTFQPDSIRNLHLTSTIQVK